MRAFPLCVRQGGVEERTEAYMRYGEGVPQASTPHGAKSPGGAAGSAGRQARTAGKTRTRVALSQTGYMHVGGVRTALFAWLVARQAKGQFILRIEDTDRNRHVEESEQQIIDSLGWLGITADEPITRQSERLDIYKQWAQKLIDSGRAYADATDEAQLNQLRDQAKAAKKAFSYRDHRPAKPPVWDGRTALRFKSEPKNYKWHDEVLGELHAGPEVIDDFIIIKSDGFPTYNFAHIIDDEEMKISHIIRSTEFLASVPKFLNLYEALGIMPPILATPPVILGPDGRKKLSKRDGAKDILTYRREGYLPEALMNFMASLGWNDGTEQEIFSVDELISKFSLERVQKSGARFDEQRLLWMNGHYIRGLPLDELAKRAESFWPPEAKSDSQDYKKAVLAAVQERLKYLAELPELTSFFFAEPKAEQVRQLYDKPIDKQLRKEKLAYGQFLEATLKALEASDFTADDLQTRLNQLLTDLKTKPGILFPTIRIALTGSAVSPEIAATLAALGKAESLKRLKVASDHLEKP